MPAKKSPRRQSKKKVSTKKTSKCKKGQILRKGYVRHAYTKSSGKHVKEAKVEPACILDQGRPGKGPSILPPAMDKYMLRSLGYSLSGSTAAREEALKRAVKKYGRNTIIWHINYVKNITAVPENQKKYEQDMKFVQNMKD